MLLQQRRHQWNLHLVKDGQTLVKAAYRFCRSHEETILFDTYWQFLQMVRSDEI